MSVKEFVRRLSIRKSKSKKPNPPSAAQWASTQGLTGGQQSHSHHQVDTGPSSMRSAQSHPALSHSFSSFAAAAASSSQPHQSSFQNPTPSMPDQFNNPPSAPLSDWIYEDIVLERRGKGLGFTFAGGIDRNDNGDGSIYVAKILSGGVAESDGRLRVNDSILSVNGASFVGVTHREAMDVLKATPNTVHLKVKRFGRASDNVEIVDLYRSQGKGLGFMVAGGIGSQEYDGDDGIFIMRITEGGIAERDGRLAVGDRLLAVNDISMTYMSHEEAVEILKNTRGVVNLLIAKANRTPQHFVNAVSAPSNNNNNTDNNNLLAPAFMNGLRPPSSSRNGERFFNHADRSNALHWPSSSSPGDPAVDSSSIRGRSTPAAVRASSSPPPVQFMFQLNPSPGFQSTPQPFTELIPRVMTGSDIPSFVKEERQVVIRKSLNAGLGFNIVGGVGGCGIFVSSVVPGGAADLNGKLRKGDQLLSVNSVNLRQVSHQEATVALKAVGEAAFITAQYRPEEFARLENLVREHQRQYAQTQSLEEQTQQPTAFFVKALFDYDASADPGPGRSLGFSFGDILYVVNAGPNDDWWQARRILPWSDVSESSGLIPSRRRVEMKFASRAEPPSLEARADVETTRTTSGNRRRRSFVLSSKTPFGKSKERLQVDGESRQQINSEDRTVPTASYETVVQLQNSLARPVIIFGPLKDRINDDLTAEFPNKFGSCVPHTTRPIRQGEVDGRDYHFVRSKETMERDIKNGLFVEAGVYNDHLYGMSAEAIKHVASQGKHCLLDVSIGAIPRLCAAEIYPITILIKPSSPMHISQWNYPISEDASRKVYSATVRLFNEFGQYFTAAASADSPTDVYARVKQIIEDHSQSLIWVTPKGNRA